MRNCDLRTANCETKRSMKSQFKHAALALLLSTINYQLSTCFAQGSLAPPGAPAPTMKSLDQIEARTPISSAPFTISSSGSYYLTENLNVTTGDAITITTSQITLDLNGFTISSTAPSATGSGILLGSSVTDIAIFNGHIKGGVTNNAGVYIGDGFANGIYFLGGVAPWNVQVREVSVSGCSNSGIYIGLVSQATVVESCVVRTVGGTGIFASSVSHCTARDCGDTGILADTAADCSAYSASGPGISAGTAANCYGQSVSGQGIAAGTALNCRGFSISSQGISAETASNCYGQSTQRGIFANVAISCSGRCDGGSYGLFATSVANTCYGLSATGTGLGTTIAIGCIGANNSGPSVLASYKYNMPP